MVGGVQSLTDEAVAADVDQFIAAHPIPQGGAMIDQALERMHVNVALRAREAQRLPAAIAG